MTGTSPFPASDRLRVHLEGEFFTGHSFSNINEQLALHFGADPDLALSLGRVFRYPTHDALSPHEPRLRPLLEENRSDTDPSVTIRHNWPPNWEPPPTGRWVHIQPWEYGPLPREWVAPLRDVVDEIWAMSHYVRRAYEATGVPADKIHVIPWGVDDAVFNPGAPPLPLPVQRSFTFLFVGSPVHRKGLDRVLDAYLAEFGREEDVCLIVKDTGARSFYRRLSRDWLRDICSDPRHPAVGCIDGELTDRELAGLYKTSDCLVAPYRGEGFCLPVLEAMACGTPAIIPAGGPTDDFATEETALVLPSQTVLVGEMPEPPVWERKQWTLSGAPTELSVRLEDLRAAMRQAFADPVRTQARGAAARASVLTYTWASTTRAMKARLRAVGRGTMRPRRTQHDAEIARSAP